MYQLALFPLHVVLFPGMPIGLHIFEPRYREMIGFCLQESQPFGVVLIRQGSEVGGATEPYMIGCTAHISEIEELPDGNFNLAALGDERFRILSLNSEKHYLTGKVENLPIQKPNCLELARGTDRISRLVVRYLRLLGDLASAEVNMNELALPDEPLALLYMASSLLHISPHEKQGLLTSENTLVLQEQLLHLYRRELALIQSCEHNTRENAPSLTWLN